MFDFVAIDFETATDRMSSACAIGIVAVKDSEPSDSFYSLLRPPRNEYEYDHIAVHGITPDQTESAPTFMELWPEISRFFDEHVPVVAHNPQFDMSVLRMSTETEIPDFTYVNSMDLASFFVEGSLSLENCARELQIDLKRFQHHNAQDDALLCANITVLCMRSLGCLNLWELLGKQPYIPRRSFSELKPIKQLGSRKKEKVQRAYPTVRPKDLECRNEHVDESHPLFRKSVVFTGIMDIDRETAMQMAVDVGALVRTAVSRKTDYLVVGRQDPALVGESGMSSKERKAHELNETGIAQIHILDEEGFLRLIEGVCIENGSDDAFQPN